MISKNYIVKINNFLKECGVDHTIRYRTGYNYKIIYSRIIKFRNTFPKLFRKKLFIDLLDQNLFDPNEEDLFAFMNEELCIILDLNGYEDEEKDIFEIGGSQAKTVQENIPFTKFFLGYMGNIPFLKGEQVFKCYEGDFRYKFTLVDPTINSFSKKFLKWPKVVRTDHTLYSGLYQNPKGVWEVSLCSGLF